MTPHPDAAALELPRAIRSRISTSSKVRSVAGRLGNLLIEVHDERAGAAYLKVANDTVAAADLRRERDRLEWLAGRLPVPRVLEFVDDGPTYLLISAIEGRPCQEWLDVLGSERTIAQLAAALRMVHAVGIDDCPFVGHFGSELRQAESRLTAGLVDRTQFTANVGMNPERALRWLTEAEPHLSDDTFTHGDYCMPNVVLADGEVAGIIDWGQAAVASKPRDFMVTEITLRRNLDTSYRSAFYEAYGECEISRDTIEIYRVLDLFF